MEIILFGLIGILIGVIYFLKFYITFKNNKTKIQFNLNSLEKNDWEKKIS